MVQLKTGSLLEIGTNAIILSQIQNEIFVRAKSKFNEIIILNDENRLLSVSIEAKYFIIFN